MQISPWHQCTCGKHHILTHNNTWGNSRCTCGTLLTRITPNGKQPISQKLLRCPSGNPAHRNN